MNPRLLSLPEIIIRFRVAIYLYWALSGAFLCYYVLYFEEIKSISASDIGLMMSLYTFSALVGQNIFGYFSDKLQSNRIPVAFGTIVLAGTVCIFPFQQNLYAIYGLMAIMGFLQQPLGPMLDAWALKHLGHYGKEKLYGKIRGLGSLGWASAAIFTAYLIQAFGWNIMYWIVATAATLLFITVITTPDYKSPALGTARQKLTPIKAFKSLFGNVAYIYILIIIFLLYVGVQTIYNFLGLVIKDTGGGVIELGWTYFIGTGSEIPAMFLSVWLLSRFVPRKLMIGAVCLYLIRFAIILYFQTSLAVTLASVLEGIAFGLMLTALRKYIFDIVSPDVQTSALTISDAVFLGLSVMVGGAVGGWVIQNYSVMALMAIGMASSPMVLVLLLIGKRFDHHPA